MKIITICGGGSLGHVVAGWLSARNHAVVNILTGRPEKWQHNIEVDTPDEYVGPIIEMFGTRHAELLSMSNNENIRTEKELYDIKSDILRYTTNKWGFTFPILAIVLDVAMFLIIGGV